MCDEADVWRIRWASGTIIINSAGDCAASAMVIKYNNNITYYYLVCAVRVCVWLGEKNYFKRSIIILYYYNVTVQI